jgi:hypothetical protein
VPHGDSVCHGGHLGGRIQEKKNYKGRISTNFFLGGKPDLVYFAGGKHIFTLVIVTSKRPVHSYGSRNITVISKLY